MDFGFEIECSLFTVGKQHILTVFLAAGESTLTDAMTAAGKTYEEIAQLVAEQVRTLTAAVK